METFWQAVSGYMIAINLAAFLVFGIDKWLARHEYWRISERTLLLLAFAGGGLGAYAGMKTFHHKTMKRKFTIGVPLLLVGNVAILGLLVYLLVFR